MISILNTCPEIGMPIPEGYEVKVGDILGWPNNKNKILQPIYINEQIDNWKCVSYPNGCYLINVGANLQLGDKTIRERTIYWGHESPTEEELSLL